MAPPAFEPVVLTAHDGRPTLLFTPATHDPDIVTLSWMIFGHVEDFEVWLHLPITVDEANDFTAHGPRFIDRWLPELAGRRAAISASVEGVGELRVEAMIPGVVRPNWYLEQLTSALESKAEDLEEHGDPSAAAAVRELISA